MAEACVTCLKTSQAAQDAEQETDIDLSARPSDYQVICEEPCDFGNAPAGGPDVPHQISIDIDGETGECSYTATWKGNYDVIWDKEGETYTDTWYMSQNVSDHCLSQHTRDAVHSKEDVHSQITTWMLANLIMAIFGCIPVCGTLCKWITDIIILASTDFAVGGYFLFESDGCYVLYSFHGSVSTLFAWNCALDFFMVCGDVLLFSMGK